MILRVVSCILKYTSISLKPAIIGKGVGVTLQAPHGLGDWIIYDKYREFEDKRKKEIGYLQARVGENVESARCLLQRLASKSIRAELKLGKKYLKKHGLDRGNCWTVSKVKEVYVHELALLRLGELPSLTQIRGAFKQVDDPKLRCILVLWASGEDLSDYYGRTMLGKYRRAIRDKSSIDILLDQPVLERSSINLSDIFDSTNMKAGFPKWARNFPELVYQ